ncbi:GAF domain protein [Vibrio sp. UCD-FRSSP16_10]|uniref:HlyD family efflux transporter periplasmic adaptor subunit n=1 Tax=unclassified Vibrio TaxID=2614977 RepID=UPI0007FD868E|nr:MULTISPECIES: HlyD family efflux transporter periplasmic adaptor subunit [unclassified Vibrio]OBT08538.1 GAF domain protein [Vibrio sp. UCD-FRSSP16_30]OBT18068.1 GAF domain protein [Vibrio sp. UCD-FRSSP16_10]
MTQQVEATPVQETDESCAPQNDYYYDWLAKHKSIIAGLQSAVIYLPIKDELVPVASFQPQHPTFSHLTELLDSNQQAMQPQVMRFTFSSASASASSSTQTAQVEQQDPNSETFGLLYPILDEQKQLIAFACFAVQVHSQAELTQSLTLLQWSAAGIEVAEHQLRARKAKRQQQSYSTRVDILARVLSESSYGASATCAVTELAVLLNCDRVSIGHYKRSRCHLKHLSHSAQFGQKMNHVRQIERVMDECVDQGEIIRYPNTDTDEPLIIQAHQTLSAAQGEIGIMSIPLYLRGEIYGALVVEGKSEQIWSVEESELCQSIISLILPTLEDKQINDRPVYRKVYDATNKQLGRLFGPKFLGRKLFVIGIAIVGYLLATTTSEYKLSANAQIESAVQRAIVAPYDGYIYQAMARAGDQVIQGEPLIQMDDRDLRLERLKWLSEESKLVRQRLEALSIRDRAKINILSAQESQVQAQLALVESQLDRGRLLSPYDGLVVSGDLSQRLGSAVNKGDLLLEVAPINSHRVKLQVPESRIADLQLGQSGRLYLAALPEQGFEFEVSKLTPVTEAIDGASYFIVEATLNDLSKQLQPGMEGIGKVAIDERLLFDIWTRDMLEWMRLQAWSWWG